MYFINVNLFITSKTKIIIAFFILKFIKIYFIINY